MTTSAAPAAIAQADVARRGVTRSVSRTKAMIAATTMLVSRRAASDQRPGLPGSSSPDDADPVHGRKHARGSDLQYACTFDLEKARLCAAGYASCDCRGQSSPLPICDASNPTLQIAGKAFPSIRPFEVARRLGDAAVVASICPARADRFDSGQERAMYRPAMARLADRRALSLTPAR